MNNGPTQDFINFDHKEFAKMLYSLSPMEFTTLGCIIGLIITPLLTVNEQNSLGNFFELVGQVLLTANAQATLLTPNPPTKSDLNDMYNNLNNKINNLFKEFQKFK